MGKPLLTDEIIERANRGEIFTMITKITKRRKLSLQIALIH